MMVRAIVAGVLTFLVGCASTPTPMEDIYYKIKSLEDSAEGKKPSEVSAIKAELAGLAVKNKNVLIEALKSGDVSRRASAAAALGYIKEREIVTPLTDALADPEGIVRTNSAISLGMLGFEDTPIEPIKMLLDDSDASVRSAGVYALIYILREGRDSGLYERLLQLLNDGSIDVRAHAILALGTIGKKDAMQIIAEKGTADKSPLVRNNAAIVLGSFKDKTANPYLIEMLRDNDHKVVYSAATSLVKVNGEDKGGGSYSRWRNWWEDSEKQRKAEEKARAMENKKPDTIKMEDKPDNHAEDKSKSSEK